MSPSLRGAVMASALLIAGLAGFLAHRHWLAEPAADTAAQSAEQLLPEIQLPDSDGELRDISEWSGQPLVINFWATWCAPCRREIPLLVELQEEYGSRDLQIIGVALDEAAAVAEFLAEMPVNYPVLVGQQEAVEAATALGLEFIVLPFTAFADRDGRIVKLQDWFLPQLYQRGEDPMVVVRSANETETPASRSEERLSEFDVFLSHQHASRERVIQIAEQLRDRGLRVWLDVWHMPHEPIQLALESGVAQSRR